MGILDSIGKIASSALPAIGSVASSLLSSSSNVQLAREQREWDYKMWKENNEYNTPANQVQRLRDAGLNPALSMANGVMDSGTSSSSPGGQTAPTVDFSPIAQGLRDSVDLYQQKRLQDAQIEKLNTESENQSIRNRYENRRQILELQQMLENKNLTVSNRRHINVEIDRLLEENKWIEKRNASSIALNDANAKKAHAEVSYFELLSEGQRIANEFAPKHNAALLRNIAANTRSLLAAANASDADAAYKVAQKALTEAQKEGVEIDNDTRDRIADALVDKAFGEAESAYYGAGNSAKQYYGGRIGHEVPTLIDESFDARRRAYSRSHPSKRK